jgi:hypothetical protein
MSVYDASRPSAPESIPRPTRNQLRKPPYQGRALTNRRTEPWSNA